MTTRPRPTDSEDDVLQLVSDDIPLRTTMYREEFYASLDAGIRFAVRVLHAHGIETSQSCQGGEGHAYDRPTIDLGGRRHSTDGFAALHHLNEHGLPVRDVAWHWRVERGMPVDNMWRVTFWDSMEGRADDELMFVWGYKAQRMRGDR